jgi:hypothetical protein
MVNDPLVVALATALEGLLTRGLEVTPCGDGWTIRLVDDRSARAESNEAEQVRRSW